MRVQALVVDATPELLPVTAAAGFDVVAAATGEAALYEFGRHHFDVAVVALRLTGLSGVEVCRELRSRSRIPILVASGHGDDGWLAALDAGADAQLDLPCAPAELRARVAAVARRRHGALAAVRAVRLGDADVIISARQAEVAGACLDRVASTVLGLLCERPGALVSRAAIVETLRAMDLAIVEADLDTVVDALDAVLVPLGAAPVQRASGAYRVAPTST